MPPTPPPNDPNRGYSFADFSTNNPGVPHQGDKIDQEIDRSNSAITQLKAFVRQSLADDGTLKPGSVGNDQLTVDLTTQISNDVLALVNPQVTAAQGHAASAQTSANTASGHANDANAAKLAAQASAGAAADDAADAELAKNQAQTHALTATNAASTATNARNTAQGAENNALNYATLSRLWSEHLDGNNPIPEGTLGQMGVTGSHWSARWWALQAALYAAAAGSPVAPMPARSLLGNLLATAANPTPVSIQKTADFDDTNDEAIPTSKAVADYANQQIAAFLPGADVFITPAQLASALAGYVPTDSDLGAIAALSTTPFGRALLELADAAAARAALGLGTAALNNTGDFQPADPDLTAIAALTTSPFGREFLDRANAAAARAHMELGSAALLTQARALDPQFTVATGTGDAITLAPGVEADAAVAGVGYMFLAPGANTGNVTITVPVFGTVTLRDQLGAHLVPNSIRANGLYYAESVSPTEFRLIGVIDPAVLFNVPPKWIGFRFSGNNLILDIDEQLVPITEYRDWEITVPAAAFSANANQNLVLAY